MVLSSDNYFVSPYIDQTIFDRQIGLLQIRLLAITLGVSTPVLWSSADNIVLLVLLYVLLAPIHIEQVLVSSKVRKSGCPNSISLSVMLRVCTAGCTLNSRADLLQTVGSQFEAKSLPYLRLILQKVDFYKIGSNDFLQVSYLD